MPLRLRCLDWAFWKRSGLRSSWQLDTDQLEAQQLHAMQQGDHLHSFPEARAFLTQDMDALVPTVLRCQEASPAPTLNNSEGG